MSSNSSFDFEGLAVILIIIFSFILIAFYVYCAWRIFEKAGKPGWASLIPIFNTLVELEIVQRPLWWVFLMFIPGVNLVITVIIIFDLAKVFGKDNGFAFGLLFLAPIFVPILALGNSVYMPRNPVEGQSIV
jgi:amino acid transporter